MWWGLPSFASVAFFFFFFFFLPFFGEPKPCSFSSSSPSAFPPLPGLEVGVEGDFFGVFGGDFFGLSGRADCGGEAVAGGVTGVGRATAPTRRRRRETAAFRFRRASAAAVSSGSMGTKLAVRDETQGGMDRS